MAVSSACDVPTTRSSKKSFSFSLSCKKFVRASFIISNNQNEVLKRLSTITIFLSIPVLIASIYGMNVPVPYQTSTYAFWIPVILSIVILGFVVINYLRRTKR
ncbi:MAG: hypothetical protein H7258_05480 [Ferruginibacter sp.]|nr:hypothetical protein [Ferruginibacter sp.]